MEDQELGGQMLTLENENGVRQAGVIETRVMPQAWEGYYEGYFMLKNHGHEQRIFESFAVWRSEKVSTFLECQFGVKTKVVRAETLNKTDRILSRGDPYLIVSRTFIFLTKY